MPDDILKQLDSILTRERVENSPDRDIIYLLISALEEQSAKYDKLYEAHLQLRDDYNHLIGEQGRPDIAKKGKGSSGNNNHSSEKERSKGNSSRKGRGKRNHKVEIHQEKICPVNKEELPADAIFKGYSEVIIQDIIIRPNNTKLILEKYYSPSEKKTYYAERPKGYEGEFGPELKTFLIEGKAIYGMSEPGIFNLLKNHGIFISQSTISKKLIENNDAFHKESKDILKAGIGSSDFLQTDTTGANVNGVQYNTHIFSNFYFTAFRTGAKKDRLSTIKHIMGDLENKYLFDNSTFQLLSDFKVAKKWIKKIRNLVYSLCLSESELKEKLSEIFGLDAFETLKKRVTEAGLIAYYWSQEEYPVPKILLTDDAPQYDNITEEHQLCWVHEARHYKKLKPKTTIMKEVHKDFMDKFWRFYNEMLAYTNSPSPEFALKIEEQFKVLFGGKTEYKDLNLRIEKTYKKMDVLLTFVRYPNIPLHNNDAELGARAQVRYRDVSLFTRNEKGTKAVDTYLTIVKTAKKLDLNPSNYISGLIRGDVDHRSLAEIIAWKSQKATADDRKDDNYNTEAKKMGFSQCTVRSA